MKEMSWYMTLFTTKQASSNCRDLLQRSHHGHVRQRVDRATEGVAWL